MKEKPCKIHGATEREPSGLYSCCVHAAREKNERVYNLLVYQQTFAINKRGGDMGGDRHMRPSHTSSVYRRLGSAAKDMVYTPVAKRPIPGRRKRTGDTEE